MTDKRPMHYLGPDLLPPHPLDGDGGYQATPVLGDVDCPDCIDVLVHA